MTHTEHVMIGLIIGGAGVLWRVATDGLAQLATLRSSKREIDQAVAETEREIADAEEETEELRNELGSSVAELEKLTQEYTEMHRSRKESIPKP